MNKFDLYINDTQETGAVFPFRFSELLDERLDEAYVDIYGSTVEAYTPLSKVTIDIYQSDVLKTTLHYIVANDNSAEYPIGKQKKTYKHTLHLLERTKLLDGIVCSSLTFTNAKGIKYNYEKSAWIFDELGNVPDSKIASISIKENYVVGSAVTFDPVETFCEKILPQKEGLTYTIADSYNEKYKLSCIITNLNTNVFTRYTKGETPTIESIEATPYEVQYICPYTVTDGANSSTYYYHISFMIYGRTDVVPLKKWTITDCVNRVLECAKPLFGTEKPEYTFDGVTYSNGIASTSYTENSDAEKYDKILAPEFSMTQCTLREQLKIIGSFIHAEPYLADSKDSTGNIKTVVKFQPLGTTEKCTSLENKEYVYSSTKTDINQYCTDVRANIDNIVTNSEQTCGTIGEWGKCVRSNNVNERITETNALATTEKKIYTLISVSAGVADNDKEDGWLVHMKDITEYVYESTDYNARLSSYAEDGKNSKAYAAYYTIGKENIDGLFYKAPHKDSDSLSYFSITNMLSAAILDLPGEIRQQLESDIAEIDSSIIACQESIAALTDQRSVNSTRIGEIKALLENEDDPLIVAKYEKQIAELLEKNSELSAKINKLEAEITRLTDEKEELEHKLSLNLNDAEISDTAIQERLLADASALIVSVTYIPYYSSIVSHGKNTYDGSGKEYTQIYNQSENVVDAQYIGENIKGVAARLGNTEEERTYILDNFSDIPEAGQMLDEYAISSVSTEIMPNHIKCTVGLSKDFNRISEYVGVNSVKRLYEVSEREVYDRNILIKENLIVCKSNSSQSINNTKTPIHSINGIYNLFDFATNGKEDNNYTHRINTAQITNKNKKGGEIASRLLPCMTSAFGNVAVANLSAKDNYSAGVNTTYFEKEEKTSGRWQKDEPYADYFGRIYWLDFSFYYISALQSAYEYSRAVPTDYWIEENNITKTNYISASNLRLRKDSREKISITCNLEAKAGSSDIIIGSEFMKLCRSVNRDVVPKLMLYVYKEGAILGDDIPLPPALDKFDFNVPPADNTTYTAYELVQEIPTDKKGVFGKLSWSISIYQEFSITEIKDDKGATIKNQGFGWIIATAPKNDDITVQDEDGAETTQTIQTGGKVLLMCTSTTANEPIALDFFITRD